MKEKELKAKLKMEETIERQSELASQIE